MSHKVVFICKRPQLKTRFKRRTQPSLLRNLFFFTDIRFPLRRSCQNLSYLFIILRIWCLLYLNAVFLKKSRIELRCWQIGNVRVNTVSRLMKSDSFQRLDCTIVMQICLYFREKVIECIHKILVFQMTHISVKSSVLLKVKVTHWGTWHRDREDDEERYRSRSDVFTHEHFILSGELRSVVVYILYFDVHSDFSILVMSTWNGIKHTSVCVSVSSWVREITIAYVYVRVYAGLRVEKYVNVSVCVCVCVHYESMRRRLLWQ